MVKYAPILIEFGYGDVGLEVADFGDDGCGLILHNGEPGAIGPNRYEEFQELPPSGYMTFKNVESLDCVINTLKKVKRLMTKKEKANENL